MKNLIIHRITLIAALALMTPVIVSCCPCRSEEALEQSGRRLAKHGNFVCARSFYRGNA